MRLLFVFVVFVCCLCVVCVFLCLPFYVCVFLFFLCWLSLLCFSIFGTGSFDGFNLYFVLCTFMFHHVVFVIFGLIVFLMYPILSALCINCIPQQFV